MLALRTPLLLSRASTITCVAHRSPASGAPNPQLPAPLIAGWILVVSHVTTPAALMLNPGGCAPGVYVIPDGQGTEVIPEIFDGPYISTNVASRKFRCTLGSISVTAVPRLNEVVGSSGTATNAGTDATGAPLA